MNKSYIGIVTRHGLEALYRENAHVIRFLHRRVYRKQPITAICYSAVLDDQVARAIEWQISVGDRGLALTTFQIYSIDSGSSLPIPNELIATG